MSKENFSVCVCVHTYVMLGPFESDKDCNDFSMLCCYFGSRWIVSVNITSTQDIKFDKVVVLFLLYYWLLYFFKISFFKI